MALGIHRSLMVALFLGTVLPARAAPAPKGKSDQGPPPSSERTAAERRAVRGSAVEPNQTESDELREVRRFEEAAFPRAYEPPVVQADADAEGGALPPGLRGLWSGTGDIPGELKSPGQAKPRSKTALPDSAFLRSLKMPDLPIRWEASVLRFLDYFKNDPKGRATLASLMKRMGRYQSLFERILTERGAPKDLIFVAMMESGFQAKALSNKAAGGFWQFMPGVARGYGLDVDYWTDARQDPERATEAAAKYLGDLHKRFGSWHLAFAAFHAGYGAILRSISRFNTNDYWELCKHEAGLPWETTTYVPKILAAAIIGRNREAFGFDDVIPDPPVEFDRVEVKPGTTLLALSQAAGTTIEALADLNPALLRQRTPPDKGPQVVRVPPGGAGAASAGLQRGLADRPLTQVLRFGETLDDVARARGVAVKELRRLNGLKDTADLRGGTTIVVPAAMGAAPSALAPEDVEATLVAVPERTMVYADREQVFYRARDGDTLEEIADAFALPVDEVVQWNNLDPGAKLQGKLVLQLFVKKGFDRSGVLLLDPDKVRVVTLGSEEFHALEVARRGKTRLSYTARTGDTLAKIARRYGMEPADLARINRVSANTELGPGQTVVVYSPTAILPKEVAANRATSSRRPVIASPASTRRPSMPIAARGLPPLSTLRRMSPPPSLPKKSATAAKPSTPAKSRPGLTPRVQGSRR